MKKWFLLINLIAFSIVLNGCVAKGEINNEIDIKNSKNATQNISDKTNIMQIVEDKEEKNIESHNSNVISNDEKEGDPVKLLYGDNYEREKDICQLLIQLIENQQLAIGEPWDEIKNFKKECEEMNKDKLDYMTLQTYEAIIAYEKYFDGVLIGVDYKQDPNAIKCLDMSNAVLKKEVVYKEGMKN